MWWDQVSLQQTYIPRSIANSDELFSFSLNSRRQSRSFPITKNWVLAALICIKLTFKHSIQTFDSDCKLSMEIHFILLPSANNENKDELQTAGRSLKKITNNRGSNIEPCGTPLATET